MEKARSSKQIKQKRGRGVEGGWVREIGLQCRHDSLVLPCEIFFFFFNNSYCFFMFGFRDVSM